MLWSIRIWTRSFSRWIIPRASKQTLPSINSSRKISSKIRSSSSILASKTNAKKFSTKKNLSRKGSKESSQKWLSKRRKSSERKKIRRVISMNLTTSEISGKYFPSSSQRITNEWLTTLKKYSMISMASGTKEATLTNRWAILAGLALWTKGISTKKKELLSCSRFIKNRKKTPNSKRKMGKIYVIRLH